jgi:HSP90 family molecular chaperone
MRVRHHHQFLCARHGRLLWRVLLLFDAQEDAQELADPVRLARLIKQYSQFIQFPIKLWSAKKEAKQVRMTLLRS